VNQITELLTDESDMNSSSAEKLIPSVNIFRK